MIDAADSLNDLKSPPGNRLKKLSGKRKNQISIRVNDQWRINEIVQGKRAITADTALRLSKLFNMSDRFWLNLQTRFDLEVAKDRLGSQLEDIEYFQKAS
jgi:plasmid maintenance system antidote protein VapI